MNNMREPRYKLLRIPVYAIIDMLRGAEYRDRVIFETLPDNYAIMDVTYNNHRRCYEMLVWHETFPIVPEGCEIEFIEAIYCTLKEYVK